ncbi:GDP-mannose 4,6-dehydratase [candidate division WOR-3 bacterium]|nr:GDP-mannose 4,6-dehydratase [candidate division WOR-3 bacterium]
MYRNIIITGGAGFIGFHLVRSLLEKGSKVGVVDNLSFGDRSLLPLDDPNLIFWEADIRDKENIMAILQAFKPDVVIHLAAIHFIPYCNEHPVEAAEVNIIGTRVLFHCCEMVMPKTLFFASTAAVYPIQNGPNKEGSDLYPMDIYGITKFVGEDLAELFYRKTGICTVIGRFFNVYGPNETNPHLIPEIVTQLKAGRREIELGNLEPKRDFIHVSDLVNAIVSLVEKYNGEYGVFNIGTGSEYSAKEIVGCFEKILGEHIVVNQHPDRIRKVERMHLLADIDKIKRTVGWAPRVELLKGLKELMA